MNSSKARQYIVSAKGNAFVAAWICVLDQYKIQSTSDVPPDEWYQAFEELYLCDAVDPDVFNACNVKQVFYSGEGVRHKDVQEAFWNLKYLRSLHPGEAADCEDTIMNKRYPDAPIPSEDDMFERPPQALVQAHTERGIERALGGEMGRPRALSRPEERSHFLTALDERELLAPMIEPVQVMQQLTPSEDVRSLACQGPMPSKFGAPYADVANFNLACCGVEVELEESGNSQWWESEGEEDHDKLDLELEGCCERCGTQFCFTAAMPIPQGTVSSEF